MSAAANHTVGVEPMPARWRETGPSWHRIARMAVIERYNGAVVGVRATDNDPARHRSLDEIAADWAAVHHALLVEPVTAGTVYGDPVVPPKPASVLEALRVGVLSARVLTGAEVRTVNTVRADEGLAPLPPGLPGRPVILLARPEPSCPRCWCGHTHDAETRPAGLYLIDGEMYDEHGYVICPFCLEAAGSPWDCGRNSSAADVFAYNAQAAALKLARDRRRKRHGRSTAEIVRRSPVNAVVGAA